MKPFKVNRAKSKKAFDAFLKVWVSETVEAISKADSSIPQVLVVQAVNEAGLDLKEEMTPIFTQEANEVIESYLVPLILQNRKQNATP